MYEKIERIIKDNIEIDDLKLSPQTNFKEDLELDSFEMAQIICAIEDETGIEINDELLTKINTMQDLISYLEK